MAARPRSETSATGALQKPKNLTRWLACSLSLLANPWCGHLCPELAAAVPALLVLVNQVLVLALVLVLLLLLVRLVRLVVQAVLVAMAMAMALPARLQPSAARRGTAA